MTSVQERQANVASIERARQLLAAATQASVVFEESVRELVSMRAWEVLGYEDFAEMWKAENGFDCPTYAKVLAVDVLMSPDSDRTQVQVAREVGLSIYPRAAGRSPQAPTVTGIMRQLKAGVPTDKVLLGSGGPGLRRNIAKHGSRRTGKQQDEMVGESFFILRRDADAVAEVARQADVPKSEIYRQAVAEYLARLGQSGNHGAAPDGAIPMPSFSSKTA